jgi:hydroxyethylthiazole kinase-like uncharacterized protein yjeF
MKILSATQLKEADKYTIDNEPILPINLMERAAGLCANRIMELSSPAAIHYVFCGKGNNGADGLAIARMLASAKRKVEVFVIEYTDQSTGEFATNFKRIDTQSFATIHSIKKTTEIKLPKKENTIIIDALIGTGINKPVEGLLAEVIDFINQSGIPVISIDMPSGLPCDSNTASETIIKAGKILSFHAPKLTFLFADFYQYAGDFEILDIGLIRSFTETLPGNYAILTKQIIKNLITSRPKFSHKGTFGHALLLAGSKDKMGAALLAAKACLRSGAGLLTTHIPSCGCQSMQTALPEAMVNIDDNKDYISAYPHIIAYSAAAIGPGIGKEKETAQVLKVLIQETKTPLVIDADAINILAENKTWISFLPSGTVLTPHPKEFDRLCGTHTSDFERLQTCKEFAFKHKLIIVLKGTYTAIVCPDNRVFFNSTGNAALAKGGSGDVLTGIILGLMTRGYNPQTASMIGVYLHGLAADLYTKKYSRETMLAGDLINILQTAFTIIED